MGWYFVCWWYLIYVFLSSYATVPPRCAVSVDGNISMITSLLRRRFCVLRRNTCLGAVLDFTSNTHRSYMKFTQFFVTRTQKLCKLPFMIYYICLKISEMQTGWWSNSVRRDHTISPRVKMERGGRIQYCKIQQWITLKINTKFWNGLYIPTHLCVDLFESHVRHCNWNLIYSVRQTGDMHSLWVEDWPKGNYSLRCVQWIDDLTLLQGK